MRAGVRAEAPADIRVALWEKFLFVESWGAVGAVTCAPIGVVRALPETRCLLEGALAEIVAVARARGVAVTDDALPHTLALVDAAPPERTASMQRDIMDGRPSELHEQPGAVVRLERERGVATPLHAFLYASQLPQERRARGGMSAP